MDGVPEPKATSSRSLLERPPSPGHHSPRRLSLHGSSLGCVFGELVFFHHTVTFWTGSVLILLLPGAGPGSDSRRGSLYAQGIDNGPSIVPACQGLSDPLPWSQLVERLRVPRSGQAHASSPATTIFPRETAGPAPPAPSQSRAAVKITPIHLQMVHLQPGRGCGGESPPPSSFSYSLLRSPPLRPAPGIRASLPALGRRVGLTWGVGAGWGPLRVALLPSWSLPVQGRGWHCGRPGHPGRRRSLGALRLFSGSLHTPCEAAGAPSSRAPAPAGP